jgi:hypothetical protein
MYKWKIEIILNCGKEIVGCDENNYNNSADFAQEIIRFDPDDFYAIGSLDHRKQICFRVGDVSSMSISILEE